MRPWVKSTSVTAQYVQLIVSCTVLGAGVSLLLKSRMGADGYSTLVSGLTLQTGWPFWLMNIVVGAIFVALAWLRGRKPGEPAVDLVRRRWTFLKFPTRVEHHSA